jgi:hypothetical protein
MQPEADFATQMTKLASDYGPFLFAILFSLIVPLRAFHNFRDCTMRFPSPDATQSLLIHESETYFRSTWIAGFVLIALAVGWWLYLNFDKQVVIDNDYWVSYEGEISGVSSDDILDSAPDKHVYIWAVDQPYRHYQYIVLQHPDEALQPIPLLWLSASRVANQASGYVGVLPVTFLLDPKTTTYALRRDGKKMRVVSNSN